MSSKLTPFIFISLLLFFGVFVLYRVFFHTPPAIVPVQDTVVQENSTTAKPSSNQEPEKTIAATEDQRATKTITDAIATDIATWETFTSADGRLTFRYPLALFPTNTLFPHNEDMGSFTQSLSDWRQAIGSERLKQYIDAMKGNGTYQYSSESNVIAQQKQTIIGLTFLVGIDAWQGGCTLHYDADTETVHIEFVADVCRDTTTQSEQWQKNPTVWANEVVRGALSDPLITAKQQALLKIISTITVK